MILLWGPSAALRDSNRALKNNKPTNGTLWGITTITNGLLAFVATAVSLTLLIVNSPVELLLDIFCAFRG